MIADTPPPSGYDLWAPHVRANPFPLYTRLRENEPIAWLVDPHRQMPFWLVTRYSDVVQLTRDARLSQDHDKLPEHVRRKFQAGTSQALNRHMLFRDPPDHARLRSLVSKAFTPRRVEELRPRISALCAELLQAMRAQGEADFIEAFAFPLPITVIAELLGVPLQERSQFRAWASAFFNPPAQGGMERIHEALQQFQQYFERLITLRRSQPGEDLVSALVEVEEQGSRLSSEELLSTIFLLLIAGYETTVHLLGNGTLALLCHPEQLQRLREERTLVPSAVEEMLRYCGPLELSTARFALDDMELHGRLIKAGEVVRLDIVAANHDPEQFSEPERFDVARSPNRHIAFGHGIHFCLGASLARLEATVAMDVLLEVLAEARLVVAPEQLAWRSSAQVRGLQRLPLAFS